MAVEVSQLGSPIGFELLKNRDEDTDTNGDTTMDTDASIDLMNSLSLNTTENTIPEKFLRSEWIGTAQLEYLNQHCYQLQASGELDAAIVRRRKAVADILATPYNPALFLELSYADLNLSFHDIAVANAHKSILLTEAALGIGEERFQPHLKLVVQKAVVTVLRSFDENIIFIELQDVYRKACRALLEGILGCAAYRDGIQQAKRALRRFPKDHELLELQASLKLGLKGRMEGYRGMGAGLGELPALTRWGKIYQKPYPWLKEELNHRTPALLEQINKRFGAGNCAVSRVVFDPLGSGLMGVNNDNTGPLGIFATKDTKAGDIVVVDESITGISTVSPRRLEHCDACHGTLTVPYQLPHETVKAPCCGKVAYCGMKCWNSFKKYHEIICEKDFEWLYTDDNHGANGQYTRGSKWRPIMFLRIMAIILGDRKVAIKKDKAHQHPLQHPLIARMAANYTSNSSDSPDGYWQYFENVTAPTKILMMLGIDIFADQEFTPEVITTIYWRLENNANMSSINLYPEIAFTTLEPSKSKYAHLTDEEYKELYDRNAVHLVSINSQYLFFNHSCEPNVLWHGAIPDPSVDISWLRGYDGKFQKVGSSTVFCRASRDIKKGEELKISYIGNPKGTQDNGGLTAKQSRQAKRAYLTKWFPNGCGCQVCEEENRPTTESFAVAEGS